MSDITTWGIRLILWGLGFVALARFTTLAMASKRAEPAEVIARTDAEAEEAITNVSVIIPARNEADSLPALLTSLGVQSLKPFEVIVVDDTSTDGSAEVARQFDAQVLSSNVPARGWTGKSHACWVGARAATGNLLCFIDSDVTLGERGLETLVRTHRSYGGLVSTIPRHVTTQPYEALSAFFNVVSAMGTGAFGPFGRRGRTETASGPAMICSAADYQASGGHRDISGEIVDDVALGRSFAKGGLPVWCFTGGSDITYRMYPSGMNQLIEGWSKNFATGAAWISIGQFALVAAWITGALTAVLVAANAYTQVPLGSSSTAALVAPSIYYMAYAAQIRHFENRLGRFPRWAALLFPVALIFFAAVFLCSFFRTYVLHRVSWKGRTIRV